MEVSAVTLLTDDESREADESTVYLISNISAINVLDDGKSNEADDKSSTYTASEMKTATYNEGATHAVGETETAVEANDESATSTVSKMTVAHTLKTQTEETWINLLNIAEDVDMDQDARCFAETSAKIVEWWQKYAKENNPTSHLIEFGVNPPINLLMVLALLPEKYQGFIRIRDEHRSPFGNGENLSWLHEQTMDMLLGLRMDPVPASARFGQGLALMVRDDVDEGWQLFTGRSWLEDQIHLWSNNELELDLYRFPPETKKIVFFFNPTEIHWTVVDVVLQDDVWTYTLYNSLSQGERGPTWKACQKQFPLLEQLICRASGFTEPGIRKIVAATSTQQENPYDCGPIAIHNAGELLEGRTPKTDVSTENLRLMYLRLILDALCLLNEGLPTSTFRARMREIWLDHTTKVLT